MNIQIPETREDVKELNKEYEQLNAAEIDNSNHQSIMTKDELKRYQKELVKKKGYRRYQARWNIYIMKKSGKIKVIYGPTGSGKNYTMLGYVRSLGNLYKNSSTRTITILGAPQQILQPLQSLSKKLIFDLLTNVSIGVIGKDDTGYIINKNIYKSLSNVSKEKIDSLIMLGRVKIFNPSTKKNKLETFDFMDNFKHIVLIGGTKIIRENYVSFVDEYVSNNKKPDDFTTTGFHLNCLIDEGHAENHSTDSDLYVKNTRNGKNSFSENAVKMFDSLIAVGFETTLFTGTSSLEQRKEMMNKKSKVYFDYLDLRETDKLEIAINNTFLHNDGIQDLLDDTSEEMVTAYQSGTLERTTMESFGASGKYISLTIDDTYLKTYDGIFDDDIKQTVKEAMGYKRFSNSAESNTPLDEIKWWLVNDLRSGKDGFTINKYLKKGLKRQLQKRVYSRDGIALIKTSEIGITTEQYKDYILNDEPQYANSTLIWNSDEMYILSGNNTEEFSDMDIEDVLDKNPHIKQIVIKHKLTTGFDHSEINTVFFLQPERKDKEHLTLEQIIGRGVRKSEEGLYVVFLEYGKNEQEAMERIVFERKTILFKKDYDLIKPYMDKFTKLSKFLVPDEVFEQVGLMLLNVFNDDKTLRNYVKNAVENQLSVIRSVNNGIDVPDDLKYFKQAISNGTSLTCEYVFPKLSENMKQRGGTGNRDDCVYNYEEDGLIMQGLKRTLKFHSESYSIDIKVKTLLGDISKENISQFSLVDKTRRDGTVNTDFIYVYILVSYDISTGKVSIGAVLSEFSEREKTTISYKELMNNNGVDTHSYFVPFVSDLELDNVVSANLKNIAPIKTSQTKDTN